MARPPKKGLSYFPMDVDFFQDPKIAKLSLRYGPLGVITYNVLLTMIYREGYFAKLSISDAALNVVRTVGDRWYMKNGMSAIDLASEIILYCAEIGLLDESLVRQEVMSSVGIQRRYAAATARNKVKFTEYRLLDDSGNSIVWENAPKTGVSATETKVFAAETPVSTAEMSQRKEKKIKVNESRCRKDVHADEVNDGNNLAGTVKDVNTLAGTGNDGNTLSGTVKVSDCLINVCGEPQSGSFPDSKQDNARQISNEFKRLLPALPSAGVTDKLKKLIHDAGKPVEYYTRVFEVAAQSSFLNAPRTGWSCSLEWLCAPENAEKVLSGRYADFDKVKPVKVEAARQEPVVINGVESGFDTGNMFEAALRRGMQNMAGLNMDKLITEWREEDNGKIK